VLLDGLPLEPFDVLGSRPVLPDGLPLEPSDNLGSRPVLPDGLPLEPSDNLGSRPVLLDGLPLEPFDNLGSRSVLLDGLPLEPSDVLGSRALPLDSPWLKFVASSAASSRAGDHQGVANGAGSLDKLVASSAAADTAAANAKMGDHILAFHMVLRELRLGPAGPTELEMDATAVSNGVSVERVARRKRYQATRLAKIRLWIADGALCLIKVLTGDIRSDILSKPVAPVGQFLRLATLLHACCYLQQSLPPFSVRSDPACPSGGA
jgi:hypothetical protein